MRSYKIAVLAGDGIGPEVMNAALKVLNTIGEMEAVKFEYEYAQVGGCAIDETGYPISEETLDMCKRSDSVLLGAVGGPKWESLPQDQKPEQALLKLRGGLGLYSNLRPAVVFPALADSSSLREEVVSGVDVMVVRELTGGIYFGTPKGSDQNKAWNTMVYERHEVERIAHVAFDLARKRSGRVTSVDKANVLDVSQFWRDIVIEVHKQYPDIKLDHMYVDNAAMQLVRTPKQFDVIVTSNMFGDILSDIASMVTGSLGMLPSASLGEKYALYEPVHGSAPDIAGQGKANPLAMIMSVSMMLNYTLDLPKSGLAIQTAISEVLESGYRTAELYREGDKLVSTDEMSDLVIKKLTQVSERVT
ncbi:MAG: 3-isopropylmalate dehydrogenase [Candidatus Marinimicrobia bacterium]|nr:3-isopropylmalate dehydrogenase [Candidatus Neomarinimicrobiota bacterium]